MASAVSSEHVFANNIVKLIDHDPGATTAVIASADGGTTPAYVDGRDAEYFAVVAKPNIVGGTGLTKLEIVASTSAAFSSVTVVKDSGTVAADALADYVCLECNMAEVADLGANLRYLAARLTMGTATDEATVCYIQTGLRFAYTGRTANNIT